MTILVSAFTVPKRDASTSDNQDAVWPRALRIEKNKSALGRKELAQKRGSVFVGIADGASEGVLSGEWANIILSALSKAEDKIQEAKQLIPQITLAATMWERLKRYRTQNGSKPLTALPSWLEDEAIARGAFATACAAWFEKSGEWSGIAIGDSCMFHVRQDNYLVESWPLSSSAAFNNNPYLIGSEGFSNADLEMHVHTCRRKWEIEDRFYFATDALACWILKQQEQKKNPWPRMHQFDAGYPDEFTDFVKSERKIGEMRNDDTTLIRVTFLPHNN